MMADRVANCDAVHGEPEAIRRKHTLHRDLSHANTGTMNLDLSISTNSFE